MELARTLLRRLRRSGVHIETPDGDTVLFRNIPLRTQEYFNKDRTNLLCKKAGRVPSYLVFVDEDLAYRGPDTEIHRAFNSGPTQSGWRVLMLGNAGQPDAGLAVENGLAALGFPDGEPRLQIRNPPAIEGGENGTRSGCLEAFAVNLSERIAADEDMEPTVGRVSEAEAVVSCLLRWGQARLPVIAGPSGVGKSNLLYAAARLLRKARPDMAVLRVDMAELFSGALFEADREKMLTVLLNDAGKKGNVVLALEHLECAAREISHGLALLSDALDKGMKVAGTVLPRQLARFRGAPLARRIQPILLKDPSPAETADILERLRTRIGAHHRLEIDPDIARLCLKKALELQGHLPAQAIALMDEAGSNASLLGAKTVSPDDVYAAFTRCGAGAKPREEEDRE